MNEAHPLLLSSKFRIPQSIPGAFRREQLENQLLKALDYISVCLITAPAGFGKTTIVSQSLRQWGHPIAWLQLDQEDNDPVQFWNYFIAALQMIHADLPSYAPSIMSSPDSHEELIKIANYLEQIKEPFSLVLDDFHHIVSDAIYGQLEWFISHEVPSLRLILISRGESRLHLARLQVRHHLEIINSESLRFTSNEVKTFLKTTMALHVAENVITELTKASEGWPAALHLMALRLRHLPQEYFHTEHLVYPDINITNYFDEEIFNPLPREVQNFLLRTSILKDIQPEVCEEIAGDDGLQHLEQLNRNQSFVIRMDSNGVHYRYHSLFAEYLQLRLKRDYPEWFKTAHRQAATYFQQHNMVEMAVEHALASGDLDYAETLVSETAWKFISLGRRETVRAWLENIPTKRLENNPRLCVHFAWVLYLQGHFDRVEQYLLLADRWLSNKAHLLSRHDSQMLLGEMHTIRALLAHLSGNLQPAIEHAQLALQLLPEDQTFMRGCALGNLGYAQWAEGNAVAGQQAIENDEFSPYPPDELTRLLHQSNQANMLVLLGNLHEAAQLFRNVIATAQADPQKYQIVSAIAYCGMGLVEYAWNNLDEAAEDVRLGLQLGQPWIYMNALLPAYLTLARIEQTRQHPKAADQALSEMESHIQSGNLTQMRELLEINRIRLKIMRGDITSGRKWTLRLQNHDERIEPNSTVIWRYITQAEVLITQNQADEALQLLQRLNALCGFLALAWMQLDVQLLECIAYWQLEQEETAFSLLRGILVRSEPEGHIRLFLDRGATVEEMLRRLHDPLYLNSYLSDLLCAFEVESRYETGMQLESSALIHERLSPRELEILSLIAMGASNKDIADKLVISEGTVKTHVKHILSKLGAQNRTDAIAKARLRSLLD